jgi:threonine aldolase
VAIQDLRLPPPPSRFFASDNASGIHPRYLEAMSRANTDHALAYGDDALTSTALQCFRDLSGANIDALICFGGTGANVTALSILIDRAESVICTSQSHISVDETGAPERILGVKLQSLETSNGKLTPEHIHNAARQLGNVHHVQPGVVSISQPTEVGSLYSIEEIQELVETAHHYNMRFHIDGARIANAVAALGCDEALFSTMTFDIGIDAISFGGTKNAMLNAEVVLLAPKHASRRGAFLRKQNTQLPSKMRFTAAQFIESFTDGLWLETAAHANAMARSLFNSLSDISSLGLTAPAVNSLYPTLHDPAKSFLQDWCFFWDWDVQEHTVRWMTSWDTTLEDIDVFSTGVRSVLDHKV